MDRRRRRRHGSRTELDQGTVGGNPHGRSNHSQYNRGTRAARALANFIQSAGILRRGRTADPPPGRC